MIDRTRYGKGGLLASEYAEVGIPAGYSPSSASQLDYKRRNADLAHFGDGSLWSHFLQYGWYEGRTWNYALTDTPASVLPPSVNPNHVESFSVSPAVLIVGAIAAYFFLKD